MDNCMVITEQHVSAEKEATIIAELKHLPLFNVTKQMTLPPDAYTILKVCPEGIEVLTSIIVDDLEIRNKAIPGTVITADKESTSRVYGGQLYTWDVVFSMNYQQAARAILDSVKYMFDHEAEEWTTYAGKFVVEPHPELRREL